MAQNSYFLIPISSVDFLSTVSAKIAEMSIFGLKQRSRVDKNGKVVYSALLMILEERVN
jgi:hypothetical protein